MDANAAKILIAKLACIEMGVKVITSFNEAGNAQIIDAVYQDCLQEILEEHPWSFATSTIALTQTAFTPVDFGDGATIAYALPDQFLSIYKLNYPSALIRQEMISGQNVIISDTTGLIVKYVFKNDDPTTYTAKFRLALALKIAATCCFKVAEAIQNKMALESKYQMALLTAMTDDSKGSTADQMNADNIFIERMAGAGAVLSAPNGNVPFYVGEMWMA